jgi:phosphotriesterase-related protein
VRGQIRTVTGDLPAEQVGLTLIHEHLYTDLRPLKTREEVPVPEGEVRAAVTPLLAEAREAGVTLLVECTPPGIGRTPLLYRRLSEESGVRVVAATGLYKEPLLPAIAYDWPHERLVDWMVSEIEEGMIEERLDGQLGAERSGVCAGLIKLASSDQGLQDVEAKTLRAAIEAAKATGAPIASHSTRAHSALAQLDILEKAGGDPSRLIVVHSNAEPDFANHLEYARRGAWVEYDSIGGAPDEAMLGLTIRALDAGLVRQLLLSQDVCGWLVGLPNGGNDRRYAYLVADFVPKLRAAGVSEGDLNTILVENPRRILAFAR